jgi:hypothetical protein
MAFHDGFWLVAGTAAPVVALAVVVSLGDAAKEYVASVLQDPDALRAGRPARWWFNRSTFPVYAVVFYCALFNLFLQAGLLAVSLVSLAGDANSVPTWLAIVAAVGGLVLLAISAFGAVLLSVTRMVNAHRNEQRGESLDKDR